ncbi:DarT1-associated NADAR antitoxin family protein [Sulfitobacter geojensis]|uniref:DarT1-associated NADAR antitoxin family protein n=1 Tax=Sulfitobacter geojensis TaxID=1342299 RepID=UPI003B8B5F3D
MANRPIFIPRNARGPLVETLPIEIGWHPGFSVSQKQKNILELHAEAQKLGFGPVLEVSTKSPVEVGRRLSAFNLKVEVYGQLECLESVYQSSKVFSQSGQHQELMGLNPFEAKRKVREVGKGEIIAFNFEGYDYQTEPKNAFYDWLYLRAILPHEKWVRDNLSYAAYSDIEFNPKKSINCQGRAVAEFHALSLRNATIGSAQNFEVFRKLLMLAQRDE